MEYIIGISAYYHDSAACLIKNGKIISAAQEERFTRIKNDSSFPINSIKFLLKFEKIDISDITYVVYYEKPLLKFERLIETYHFSAPFGFPFFNKSILIWIKKKLFIRNIISKKLNLKKYKIPVYFSDHHLSHASSAFFPSPFESSAILTIDAIGEWTSTAIFFGEKNSINKLMEIKYPHSLGLVYSALTAYLGFKVNQGEYKVMGLSSFGNRESIEVKQLKKKIEENIINIYADGSFKLNLKFFSFYKKIKMYNSKKWEMIFGIPSRNPFEKISMDHVNLALAFQLIIEEVVLKLAKTAKKITNKDSLCLAGGVTLNCVANGKLIESGIFKSVWIQPAAGDAGGAIGAALSLWHLGLKNKREIFTKQDSMNNAFLGPEYSDNFVKKMLLEKGINYTYYDSISKLNETITMNIMAGNVIGWFQGRMEFGPRALGNRSILADPRNPKIQNHINQKIKFREDFRPFAPVIIEEDLKELFPDAIENNYMQLVFKINKKFRAKIDSNYDHFSVEEKLSYNKSYFPAITHSDFSSRIQTVNNNSNKKLYELLVEVKKQIGYGILLNTSFNIKGEPIINSPNDALKAFADSGLDLLVINNFVISK